MFKTPKTLECHTCEFRNEVLHDLHHGKISNEQSYKKKMSISIANGGLWGDLTAMY